MSVSAYPLSWPAGWKRTEWPEYSRFRTTFGKSRDGLMDEIEKLGGQSIILSTNVPIRNDGMPYASARPPRDAGVAVYFKLDGRSMVFACDKWKTVEENLHSIEMTIRAIRGIERWGASDMMERAFTGFQALPASTMDRNEAMRILGLCGTFNGPDLERAWKVAARKTHPDHGGDPQDFIRVTQAYELLGADTRPC